MAYKLSILIPARNEVCYDIDLLKSTVENVTVNTTDACEVVVVLDGWTPQSLFQHPRVTYVHHNKSIGQRAATNEAARIATGEWVCKLDAHCAVSENFDVGLLQGAEPDWTIVASQFNLLAFNWKCKKCGWLKDQSPQPAKCGQCGSRYVKQVKQWFPRDGRDGSDVDRKSGRRNTSMHCWRFDTKLEYCPHGFGDYVKRNNLQPPTIHDTMSLLGACWAIRRERYFHLDICDERYGSWGQQGTEVACKSWLSGGRLVSNSHVWFAHMFRVGGLHFPYPGGGMKERAMARCKEMWLTNKWDKQVRPLQWLIDHFSPIPDWSNEQNATVQLVKAEGERFYGRQAPPPPLRQVTKCALYYSCLSHDETLELAARNNLRASTNGHELGCVTLNERVDFGDWQIVVQREKSGTTMHYQILEGLRRSTADYVFLCESDVFYSASHFDFTPPDDSTIYYNTNVWRVRYSDGHTVRTDGLQQVSGICANRLLLLEHYRKRIELIEANGGQFDVKAMAYEPGTRGNFDGTKVANWESAYPNVDVTGHGRTLTKPKFSVDEFRNKKYSKGWQETDNPLPGWPQLAGRMTEWLEQLANGNTETR
jgi:hypothetical protein